MKVRITSFVTCRLCFLPCRYTRKINSYRTVTLKKTNTELITSIYVESVRYMMHRCNLWEVREVPYAYPSMFVVRVYSILYFHHNFANFLNSLSRISQKSCSLHTAVPILPPEYLYTKFNWDSVSYLTSLARTALPNTWIYY